jgi:hypothetical protein
MHGKFAQTLMDTIVLQAVHKLANASCNPVDRPGEPMMPNLRITDTLQSSGSTTGSRGSIDRRIRAFLNGESHGEDVLGALYGATAAEPIPERLLALFKR